MNLFKAFKNQLFKKEFLRFLLEGFLVVIVIGITLGIVDFTLRLTNIAFLSMFTLFIYYLILTKRLSESFTAYFKIYTIMAIVFLLTGYYVIQFSRYIAFFIYTNNPIETWIFNPFKVLEFFSNWRDVGGIITNVINILFFIILCYFVHIRMKRKM